MAVSQFLHLLHIELLHIVLLSLDELAVLLTLTFEIGTQGLIVSYQIVNRRWNVTTDFQQLAHPTFFKKSILLIGIARAAN